MSLQGDAAFAGEAEPVLPSGPPLGQPVLKVSSFLSAEGWEIDARRPRGRCWRRAGC